MDNTTEAVKKVQNERVRRIIPSLVGGVRFAWRHPLFAVKLLVAAALLFITRKLPFKLVDPNGFRISTFSAFISYWEFVIERQLQHRMWTDAIKGERLPLIFDIGANSGCFTYALWRSFGDHPRIEMVEPLIDCMTDLSITACITGARFHSVALGAAQGSVLMSVPPADINGIARVTQDGDTRVPMTTLDSLAKGRPVFLIKMDVEEYELQVLRGAAETLKNTRFLIIEIFTEERLKEVLGLLGPAWDYVKVTPLDYLFFRPGIRQYDDDASYRDKYAHYEGVV